jgi:thioredoxin
MEQVISGSRHLAGTTASKERPVMATIALSKDNFEQVVTGNDTVIVDFWAPWCGPCRGFAPVFEATSEKHVGVVFAKVNTEEEPELAGHFEIRSIPTLMVFREKVLLFSQPGALPAAGLEALIRKVKEIDMAQVHRDIAEQEDGTADNSEKAGTPG